MPPPSLLHEPRFWKFLFTFGPELQSGISLLQESVTGTTPEVECYILLTRFLLACRMQTADYAER
jgi:hypothetical protein